MAAAAPANRSGVRKSSVHDKPVQLPAQDTTRYRVPCPRIFPYPRACRRAPFNKKEAFLQTYSRCLHPRIAWIYRVGPGRHLPTVAQCTTPTDRRNLSKAGWVRLQGRERHGWRDRAYRDVLAASPATGPTLPPGRKPAVAVALAFAGAGRSPAGPLRRTAGPGVVPAAAARPWFPGHHRSRSARRCCRSRGGRAG